MKNIYFIIALALQKGAPYILIPFVIHLYGVGVYANYLVVYSLLLYLSSPSSLGLSGSSLVFWYDYENKEYYVSSFLFLLLSLTICLGAVLVFNAYLFSPHRLGVSLCIVFLVLLIAYNLNVFSYSIVRALNKQKEFFYTSLFALLFYIGALYVMSNISRGVVSLLLVFLIYLIMQSILLVYFTGIRIRSKYFNRKSFQLLKKILPYSSFFMLYGLFSVAVVTLDKVIVKFFYPQSFFHTYVLNFQMAYTINILSLVIGVYSLPNYCEFFKYNDKEGFYHLIKENVLLIIIGSLLISAFFYAYAIITHVHIDIGYLYLTVAFLLCNLFSMNVGILESMKMSKLLLLTTFVPTLVLLAMMVLYGNIAHYELIYPSFIVYYIFIFIVSAYYIKRHLFRVENSITV